MFHGFVTACLFVVVFHGSVCRCYFFVVVFRGVFVARPVPVFRCSFHVFYIVLLVPRFVMLFQCLFFGVCRHGGLVGNLESLLALVLEFQSHGGEIVSFVKTERKESTADPFPR